MKIVALDSSGIVASVALISDGVVLSEYSTNYKKTHSQTLLPMLDTIFKMTETVPETLDAVAVASGPGSFTGLRIGSATAKGLGLALDIPIIEVPTLEAMAYQIYCYDGLVCPMLDARRGQVYTGLYSYSDGRLSEEEAGRAVDAGEFIDVIAQRGKRVIFSGEGADVCRELIEERLGESARFAPPHLSRQRAAAVAALGEIYYNEGRIVSADDHAPVYMRLSQAERERREKENGSLGAV